jgi:hypothetical protein
MVRGRPTRFPQVVIFGIPLMTRTIALILLFRGRTSFHVALCATAFANRPRYGSWGFSFSSVLADSASVGVRVNTLPQAVHLSLP